ncbi:MAG: ATP synthase F1 subunit gamma [Planctomycetota bacterium]
MPANIREIKGRMKAVKNIQRITKTMQLIASARFQAMLKKATQGQAYADKIQAMVGQVAGAIAGDDSVGEQPLLMPPAESPNKTLVLVLTSDRGLCGSYNTNVMKLARQEISETPSRFEVVGKKGIGFAKFNKIDVDRAHLEFGDNPKYEQVAALADRLMQEFAAGQYDAVKVVYTRFLSMSKQTPETLQLLPLADPGSDEGDATEAGASAAYEFSPEPGQLLEALLPASVKVTLMRCFNDAAVSEQLARMVAMKAATDAAGKQGKALKRQFNRARQTAITTELSEIIAGAAALE